MTGDRCALSVLVSLGVAAVLTACVTSDPNLIERVGPADLRQHRPSQASGVKVFGGEDEFEVWAAWPVYRQRWNVRGEMITSSTLAENHPFRIGRRPNFWSHRLELYAQALLTRPLREGIMSRDTYILGTDWVGSRLDTLLTIYHP